MAIKNMEMNYPDLDSPYVNKLYSRMEEDNRWGSGIYFSRKVSFSVISLLFTFIFCLLSLQVLFRQ